MSSFEKKSTAAERLIIAMEEKGMKQIELAEATGMHKGTISNYVKGKYVPKQDAIYKLAKALDVSEMWLWGYDIEMERPASQKKNDKLIELVDRMKDDSIFFDLIVKIADADQSRHDVIAKILDLSDDQFDSIVHLLNAFMKQ